MRCLWVTAELQDSRLRGLSFQMGTAKFLGIGVYPLEMTSQEANCPDVQQWPTDTEDMAAWLR